MIKPDDSWVYDDKIPATTVATATPEDYWTYGDTVQYPPTCKEHEERFWVFEEYGEGFCTMCVIDSLRQERNELATKLHKLYGWN